jgi:beta-lactamase regulating signal transducer with metallopeptidase domain
MHEALMLLLKWTLTAACVAALALAGTPLLRRRYASRGLYALWVAVIAGFLIPLAFPARENAVKVSVPRVITQPIALRPLSQAQNVPTRQTTLPTEAAAEKPAMAVPAVTLSQALATVYLTGALTSAALRAARHLYFMRTVRRWSRPVEETQTLQIWAQAGREANVRRMPALVRCAAVDTPMLAGIVRPRVLLPEGAPQDGALMMVLRHELVHYRRGDLLIKLLTIIACVLHWFNPAVYLAARMTNVYCELSCDAQAVRRATIDERALYSRTILDSLRRKARTASALTTNFSADKRTLKRRLTQIMDMHVRKRGLTMALGALLLTMAIGSSFALAESRETTGWNAEPMTAEEMVALWQDSFEKMGTTSSLYYTPDSLVDQADLDAWLREFEKTYKEQTGLDRKDDLIVASTPGADDMPYDEALAHAKKMIMDKYGTPEEELDAMGVYPRLMDYAYQEDESEWEFYFTPICDIDIDMDRSDYPGPGEYRAHFTARSGEEVLCLWYIDEFWPYAQRVWDAGKRDIVYDEFKRTTFYQQDEAAQAHFTGLLKDAGYDVAVERDVLGAVCLDMAYADPAQSVLWSDDNQVKAALEAMEKTYGLDAQTLDACGYAAFYSPLHTGTTDICFVFNWPTEEARNAERAESGAEGGFQNLISGYSAALGNYMISLDTETGEVMKTTRKKRNPKWTDEPDAKLLEKRDWTAEDAKAYLELRDQRIPAAMAAAEPDFFAHEIAVHTLLRAEGGEADRFPAHSPTEAEITKEQACEIAMQAVMAETGLTQEGFQARYAMPDCRYRYEDSRYDAYCLTRTVATAGEQSGDYYVQIDAKSGETLEISPAEGNG